MPNLPLHKRGPKRKTAANRGGKPPGPTAAVKPTAKLTGSALAEFRRLVEVLDRRGTLERIDLAVPTECARITELLDRCHGEAALLDVKLVSIVSQLTSQRRGLLREMGLSIQPSRSVVKSVAKEADQVVDPVAGKIKLHSA